MQVRAIYLTDVHISDSTIEVTSFVLEKALEVAIDLQVPIIIGGDVFTSRKSQSLQVLLLFQKFIKDAGEADIQIYAIAGNHDKTDYFRLESFLDIYSDYENFHLYEAYAWADHIIPGYRFHFIPYFDESVYNELLDVVETDTDQKHWLFTHIAVNGVKNNDGSRVENDLTREMFSQFDKVIVGHYHNRQEINNILYTGSTHQANFGEDTKKGLVILKDNGAYEFVQLDTPEYVTHRIDATESSEMVSRIIQEASERPNDLFRVIIHSDGIVDHRPLKAVLQEAGIKVEIDRDDVVIEPEVAVSIESNVSDTEIEADFDRWADEKKPKDIEFGREVLFGK